MTDRPIRVQLSRRKGWRMPENTLSVARPGEYGNRYVIGKAIEHVDGTTVLVRDRAHAVQLHREWLFWQMGMLPSMRAGLRHDLGGRNLACWCGLDGPRHGDTYLEISNP